MKKTAKKFLVIVLTAVMLLTAVPLAGLAGIELPSLSELFATKAEAATSGTCGDNLTWSLDTSTGALIISGTGAMDNYTSSSSVPWDSYRSSIKSVTIGNGVTNIGDYAFYEYINIISIVFEKNSQLIRIGDDAFRFCTSLTSITIPNSVTSIGDFAFRGCTSLASITISDSVTSIGNYTFYNCDSFTSITIPDSVTSIGDYAFYDCASLTIITIPDSVKSIGVSAFSCCESLTNITASENNKYYSSQDGVLFNKDKTTLIQYPAGNIRTEYMVPNIVTSMGDSAFYGCNSISNIIIPDSVLSIGNGTFHNCGNLTNITIPNSVKSISDYAFTSCSNLTDVYYNGTENQWNAIVIGNFNDYLTNAKIHYNSVATYYTLTYNANGGSGAPASQTGATTYTISNTAPTRSGYTFLGWSTNSSAISASYVAGNTINLTQNTTLYAVWKENTPVPEEDIYNLGQETYSFENYGDSDSWGGHCFGMSITSSGYHTNNLNITDVGGNKTNDVYALKLNSTVKAPICYYQARQAEYSVGATVAGGSKYLTGRNNINSDWTEVINYVKNHEYDNKGSLQIGFRKENEGGHAINFIRYEEVNGQQRIYAYDNNFPNIETYFYKGADGKVYQAPSSTFSGAIDCIALRSVSKYFDLVKDFDSTRYIYAPEDSITVKGAEVYYMECNVDMGEYVMYEIPENVKQVIIVPHVNNAEFTYLDEEYSFGGVNDDTVATFTVATEDDQGEFKPEFEIENGGQGKISMSIKSPSITTINYGDSIILHAEAELPAGARVVWDADNGNFSKSVSADGKTCTITPVSSGDTTFIATVVDKNGNPISEPDTQTMTAKAGFFQKIIAFFKGLFGLNKIIPQAVKFVFY